MVRGRLAVGALLATAAVTSPALAASGGQPVDKFSVTAGARVEHASNMSGVSEAEARSRGISPDDTIYTPSLGVTLNLPVGRQVFFLTGYAGYLYHEKNTIYDSERVTLDTGVRGRLAICDVTAGFNYARALSSFDDIVLGPTQDNIQTVKAGRIQASCARRTGIGVTASVNHEVAENDQSLLRIQDYTRTAYSAGVTYSKPRLGTLTLFGSRSKTDYDHRIPIAGQSNGFESTAGGLTYERHLGARIDGSVTVSYTTVDGAATSGPGVRTDFSGFTYSLNASYRASQRLRLDGSFGREITPSNRFGNAYDVDTHYSLRGSYELGSRISTSLGAERRETESGGSTIFAGNLTDSKVTIVSGSMTYKMNRRIGFSLDAAHEEREANDARFEYENTRIGLSANVTY
jgi:hypothetical protein